MRPRARQLVVVALLVTLLGSACRIQTSVDVQVADDGSGSVTITGTLDKKAVDEAPDWAKGLKTDDLRAAGWTIEGPIKAPDGSQSITARKPFANTDEAARIFTEIAGPDGPFRDFKVTRTRSFARTTTAFSGTVDFAHGLGSFADAELPKDLGGSSLAEDLKAIELRTGQPFDDLFSFRVAVRLPGDVTSNAPGQATNGAVWQPKLTDTAPATLEARGRSWRVGTLVALGVAAAAFLALIVVLLVRVAIRIQDGRATTT